MAIGDNGNTIPAEVSGRRASFRASDPTRMAFFWLSGFFVVYCARPEDWIPGLKFLPLAKITAILAMWGLFTALGRTKRTFKDRGNSELLSDQRGALIPAGNESIFADAVEKLLADSRLRQQLGRNALQFTKENFSLDRVRQRYVELYVSLLWKKRRWNSVE